MLCYWLTDCIYIITSLVLCYWLTDCNYIITFLVLCYWLTDCICTITALYHWTRLVTYDGLQCLGNPGLRNLPVYNVPFQSTMGTLCLPTLDRNSTTGISASESQQWHRTGSQRTMPPVSYQYDLLVTVTSRRHLTLRSIPTAWPGLQHSTETPQQPPTG